jgi:osmotically-inducible protein OsmY
MGGRIMYLGPKNLIIRQFGIIVIASIALFLSGLAIAAPDREISDQNISDAIEDELLFDQGVFSHKINVKTSLGIVTLSGEVDNLLAKERSAELAKTVKGVRAVVNEIQVTPTVYRSDSAIRSDVEEAFLHDPATESYEINVFVNDGKVTLSGDVDSYQEKQLAETVAKGVWGVKELTNRINVEYEADRPDFEIKPEIRETLNWDTLVDDTMIDIEVSNGKVILSGTVGSAAEKTRAISDAWVSGVKGVDADKLEVAKWARDPELRKYKYVVKPDKDVEQAVKDALLYDPRVLSFNVNVSVNAGVATLRGEVDNLKAKHAAAQDARNTVGVVNVSNRIKVRPSQELSDAEIADDIRDALARNPYVESYEITVSVVNNVADLYGVVDSYFDKSEADDVASRVKGVIDVNNHLVVDYDNFPLAYNPYIGPYPYDHKWYHFAPGRPFKSDARIKDDIEDELWWSPFVDSDDITVTVNDGTATLMGTVESYSEMDAAVENAFEGGAIWVDNDLKIGS